MKCFLFFALTSFIKPEEEMRFAHSYKQGYDTSCGIAVTASLLNYYWNIDATEEDLYKNLLLNKIADTPNNSNANYTISFLDIMRCLEEYNIAARAYKMNWDELKDTLKKDFAPLLINYKKPLPHFALLLNIENDFAFVADPAKGFEIIEKQNFTHNYSGNVLLAASRTAKKNLEYIKKINSDKTKRLSKLTSLAVRRRR